MAAPTFYFHSRVCKDKIFMKHNIYVIEHPDRLGMFKDQLKTQIDVNVVLCHVPAVFRPAPAEGIAMAHTGIVKQAQSEGWPYVVIAEDDCQFFSPLALKHFFDNIPDDFDIYLGGLYAGSEKITADNRLVKYFCGLHLYIVHSRFYDQYLRSDHYMDSIDNALARLAMNGMAKIVACYPFAAVQRELLSNNSGLIFRHKAFFNAQNTLGYPDTQK